MSRDVTALEAKAKELLEMVELPADLLSQVIWAALFQKSIF